MTGGESHINRNGAKWLLLFGSGCGSGFARGGRGSAFGSGGGWGGFGASGRQAIVSVPCHSREDIDLARKEQVDMILFSPVFEKLSAPREVSEPQGLEALREACAAAQGIPVFALGGVSAANASACIAAGAAGVAGIRLFTTGDWRLLKGS